MRDGEQQDEAQQEATVVSAGPDATGERTIVGTLDAVAAAGAAGRAGQPPAAAGAWREVETQWQQRLAAPPPVTGASPPFAHGALAPKLLRVELDLPPLSHPLAEGMPPLPSEAVGAAGGDVTDWGDDPTPGPLSFATTTGRLAALAEMEPASATLLPAPPAEARVAPGDLIEAVALPPVGRADARVETWGAQPSVPSPGPGSSDRGWGWLIVALALVAAAIVVAWWSLRPR